MGGGGRQRAMVIPTDSNLVYLVCSFCTVVRFVRNETLQRCEY
jgi:hypothetical protein